MKNGHSSAGPKKVDRALGSRGEIRTWSKTHESLRNEEIKTDVDSNRIET